MPNDFVIFTRARSGSNSLVSRLDSCPDVACHGEIFKRKRIDIRPDYRRRLPISKLAERNARPFDFIAGLRALDAEDHFGFKIFLPHFETAPGAIDYVTAPATRRIVLTRAPLEVYASFLRMRATGVHKLKAGETPPPEALAAPVRFSEQTFRRFLESHDRFTAMGHGLAAMPKSFVIDYGQINDEDALDALFAFVGSTARAANSSTAFCKQYGGRLEDGFENWGALQDFLRTAPPLPAVPPPSHPPARPVG